MEKSKMIYGGLRCRVNTKAAFVDKCLNTPELSSKMLMRAIVEVKCRDQMYAIGDEKNGIMAVRLELDEEKRECIYDEVFGKRFREGAGDGLSEENKLLLEPVEKMHQKEMKIDVIPFIVYGIVRNERCRNALREAAADSVGEYVDAFRQSEYNSPVFLRKFLLEERKAAKVAAGMLLLLGRDGEKESGNHGNEKRKEEAGYRMVMDIIYAGYRSVKNVIKKLDCLDGEQYRDFMARDLPMEMDLSRMVIQMVIAEDLSIPIAEDYDFCQVVCMLKRYEDSRCRGLEQEMDMTEGKRIYRRLLREHWNPGAYYVSAFLEEENEEREEIWDRLESLFCQFGIETGALSGLCLEKWEGEMLCSIFEEKDWKRYRYLLLIATLCKYIQQIETMYETDIPEEIQYRRSCEENAVRNMEYEKKRMEQRVCGLERQKKDMERELTEAQRQIDRLKKEILKKEEELLGLRKYVSQKEGREEETEEADQMPKDENDCTEPGKNIKEVDVGRLDRSIVIGGHRNWQKKMRQCLPDSQFLASDHMHFDPAVLRNKKYIIVNTDILKHGLYYKIMSERKKGQRILYVHGNNVDRAMREIADQL